MGVVVPRRQNAGPVAARMSFFAHVSLFFFFTVLFTVVVLRKIPLHPMHYLFIASGFFAFHILLAYLVDLMDIHAAFWICAAVSVLLVVSYLRLAAGVRFALTYAAAAQLVYLVGFSSAFFWPGKTGLTVTIGAIATLFVLMQATGRVNWNEVFKRRPPLAPKPFAPIGPAAPPEPPPLPEMPPFGGQGA
jgi:inner membrane protein involved in colicin E2 resistance